MPSKKRQLGLVLAGGGARGLAHIGALKVFEQNGIKFDFIAGSSMGALIGVFYAAGISPEEMEEAAITMSSRRHLLSLMDVDLPIHDPLRGMFTGKKVREFLSEHLGEVKDFNDLKIPAAVTAVDLVTAEEVVIDEGPLLDALLATTAVPGVFKPVKRGDMELVYGGILNNLPVDIPRKRGVDYVVAVDVAVKIYDPSTYQASKLPGIAYEVERMADIRTWMLVKRKMDAYPPDYLIHPTIPPSYNIFLGFREPEPIIEAGMKEAEESLAGLKKILARKKRGKRSRRRVVNRRRSAAKKRRK